ncbi:MAG: M20/M25/M40 family metallo-hydrolase [Promethearchaeota archaeon]|nr:MAG: M20/M25/M40 family metallo-hydrolase [Candidatus Lokiarchaeota archaeon]
MVSLEEEIIKRIDEMKDEIIKFHQQSVRIPSENPPSNYKEIARFTERKMKEIGLKPQIKRRNIIAEWGNDNGKALIFNAHYDTVQAFKGWTEDPFGGEIVDGKIYGRGSCDDKSCVTAEIFAVKALIDAGFNPKGKLLVTVVGDEELGGLGGAEYLLSKGLIKGDSCLLGDAPAGYPYGYMGGTMYITITIKGKQNHGLGAPDLPVPYRNEFSGINTIDRMVKIMNFLLELNREFINLETKYTLPEGTTTKVSHINLAEIHGGNKITTVPEKCYLHCSVNTIPEQDIASIKKRLLDYIEELKQKDPYLDITVQIPISMEPFVIDGQSDFAKAVKKSFKSIYDAEREFKLFMPSCDAHWFQERGIETILIGTGRDDTNAHAVDEFVYIDDLIKTTKIYALTALNYLK